jgi:HSP20 family protein
MAMNILTRPFGSELFDSFDPVDWNWPTDPLAEFDRLNAEMNRMFQRFGRNNHGVQSAAAYPALDLWQDENFLYAEAELPGMNIDDLEIYVTGGNQLSIRGERRPPTVEGGAWHRQERGFGKFNRLLTLPCEVKTDEVEAELRDGVLIIRLPKSDAARPRRLAIKVE